MEAREKDSQPGMVTASFDRLASHIGHDIRNNLAEEISIPTQYSISTSSGEAGLERMILPSFCVE